MTQGKYILDGHQPVIVSDLFAWAKWFETAEWHVAETRISPAVRVSTIFLGLDHNFGRGAPLLFESMVFGGPLDGESDRYATWDEAADGHAALVAKTQDASLTPTAEPEAAS